MKAQHGMLTGWLTILIYWVGPWGVGLSVLRPGKSRANQAKLVPLNVWYRAWNTAEADNFGQFPLLQVPPQSPGCPGQPHHRSENTFCPSHLLWPYLLSPGSCLQTKHSDWSAEQWRAAVLTWWPSGGRWYPAGKGTGRRGWWSPAGSHRPPGDTLAAARTGQLCRAASCSRKSESDKTVPFSRAGARINCLVSNALGLNLQYFSALAKTSHWLRSLTTKP